jgi:hypothetical protein
MRGCQPVNGAERWVIRMPAAAQQARHCQAGAWFGGDLGSPDFGSGLPDHGVPAHFFTADAARDLVARYTAALPPGSLLVLSAIHVDSKGADEGFADYSNAVAPVYNSGA